MKRTPAYCLVLLAALVTGCPRNQYIVELRPHGAALERELIFYREDGRNTNGVSNYQTFPEDQLAAIMTLYPPGGVKTNGPRHIALAEFTGAMPKDVGGAGSWTYLTNSLGQAALYAERFRGNDDFASTSAKRLAAADQLTDLLIGWSRAELGREPQHGTLRQFLDVDFRNDLKNLSLYNWAKEISANFNPKAEEEFVVRFGQYLNEQGYFKLSQLPELFAVATRNDERAMLALIQRFVTVKLGLPESAAIPASLAFLADEATLIASWEKFLMTTDIYRDRIKAWELEPQSNSEIERPKPSDISEELILQLLEFRPFSTDDHLTVKLSLPSAPIHTNGKWDAARRQVVWESDLEEKEPTARLPVFCYASGSTPDKPFQIAHFGQVFLAGNDLLQYCLWRGSLTTKQAGEWEALLGSLKAETASARKLDAFRFSDEPTAIATQPDAKNQLTSEFPRRLLKSALAKTTAATSK